MFNLKENLASQESPAQYCHQNQHGTQKLWGLPNRFLHNIALKEANPLLF